MFAVLLVFNVVLIGCARASAQQFDSEDYFYTAPRGDGVVITAYTGPNLEVRIPPTIQGLRVGIIGGESFAHRNLISVTIPNSVLAIEWNAFAYNQLTSVTIPNSVVVIGDGAFMVNQLNSVTIPNRVTTIRSSAFMFNQLTSVIIPDSVTFIGASAFEGNHITSIIIGENVDLEVSAWRGPFEFHFHTFYNNNGRRAGTYTWNGHSWSFR